MTEKKRKEYFEFLNRTIPILKEKGIKKLKESQISVAGCGGVGGGAAMSLARIGLENFKLADPGKFDLPDMNRQWGAFRSTLGQNKAKVYEKILKDINPEVKINTFCKGVIENNVDEFLEGSDVLIDSMDVSVSEELMDLMYLKAREKKIYVIGAPVMGFGTIVYVVAPDGANRQQIISALRRKSDERHGPGPYMSVFTPLLKDYIVPEYVDMVENRLPTHKIPTLSLSVALATSLVTTEVLMVLLGNTLKFRKPIRGKLIVVDLLKQSFKILDPLDFGSRKIRKPSEIQMN